MMYIPKLARDAIPAIWDVRLAPVGAKAILIYYVLHMNDQGGGMRPGVQLCAAQMGCTSRTVIKWLKWLVEQGYLLPDGKYGYTDQYRLNLEKLGLKLEVKKPADKLKKTHLQKPPVDADSDPAGWERPPVDVARRNMEQVGRKLSSYWRMKSNNNPDAWLNEPGKDEVAAFLREHRAMVNRMDPGARRYELEAMYAETILREKGVKV